MRNKKTERTSKGLQEALFAELDDLIAGKSTPQQARAKAAVINGVISLARLEMDYARFVAKARALPDGDGVPAIELGT